MTWVDYILLGIIVLSVVISLFRGLIREVMALAIWGIALWVAYVFADDGAALLTGHIEVPSARMAVAFALLFIVTLLLGSLISFLVAKLVETTGLSGTDRFLGAFFGAGRAIVLITAAVMFAGLTPIPRDPWWHQSMLLPHFQGLAEWAATYMPEEVRGYFNYSSGEEQLEPEAGLLQVAHDKADGT